MKTFNNFKDAFNWISNIVETTNNQSIEEIAKKAYEESKQYIYIDTEKMYDSGNNSDFKNGYVVIKAPQVRWLYYTTGLKGHKNPNAIPQWFEKVNSENMKNYIKIYSNLFNKNKG